MASREGRQVALHFTLTRTDPVAWRVVIEGLSHGDAASVKAQAAREIREALDNHPLTGASEVFVTTLRRGSANGNGTRTHGVRIKKEANGVEAEVAEKPKRTTKRGNQSAGPKAMWAGMSPQERSAEMIRRRASRDKITDAELRIRLLDHGVATAARKRHWPERPNLWKTEVTNGVRASKRSEGSFADELEETHSPR